MQLKPMDGSMSPANLTNQPDLARMLDKAEPGLGAAVGKASPILDPIVANRFRQEMTWLAALPNLGRVASTLLAAHATGCAMVMRPGEFTRCGEQKQVFCALASVRPDRRSLERAASMLIPEEHTVALSAADLARIDALWPLTAPTEYLLASGGDDRLTLDPATGLNKYGCAPWPRPDLIDFGSCTASSLSEAAFAAAERARRSMVASALTTSPATALAEASEAIGAALLRHYGVEDLAQAVLAASGTDAALVVTGLLAAEHPGEAFTSILVGPSETGSGVPDAVQGRHFASCAPSGSIVGKGQPIDGLPFGPALLTVALRDETGAPRSPAEIDAAFETAIRTGIAAGRVVLHAMDGSKTGLTAPDRGLCRRLAHLFGRKLDIVIDACQARIEPELVRWYLRQGFPVLLTGSKFFAAPGFCGAVLFPRARLERIARAGRLPAGLAAYARLQGGFGSRRCPGLFLRWTAALHEMAIFAQTPARCVGETLDRLGKVIVNGLARDSRLRLIAAPRPAGMGWSDRRSVFTFTVSGPSGPMNQAQLRRLYHALGEGPGGSTAAGEMRCRIGQPVELGSAQVGGLRVAISAIQVASGLDLTEGFTLVLRKLADVLDQPPLTPWAGDNNTG